jgi:hypothetical protein
MKNKIISYIEVPEDYWVVSKPENIEIEYIIIEED